eukprot:5183923-Alexandrium_andersonii.AAC.1
MAEAPHGRRRTPPEAHWDPLRAAPKQAPYYGRERSDRATWGTASQCPELPCKSIFARGPAPGWGRL